MRKGNTVASETASNCRQKISVTDSFDFESQSRLHHCETKTARDKSILLCWSVHIDVPAFFRCPNAGYSWMTGWMGYDFAITSFRRVSETTPPETGAGTEKRHSDRPAENNNRMRQKECRIPQQAGKLYWQFPPQPALRADCFWGIPQSPQKSKKGLMLWTKPRIKICLSE